MDSVMFFKELIFLDHSFKNSDEFFDFIFPHLLSQHHVKETFLTSIKARERLYPTALPTQPYVVALPHTDVEHIIKPFISFVRLKETAAWHEMANNDQILAVKFIFLLGFIDKDGHINLLQTLINKMSDPTFMEHLNKMHDIEELVTFLNTTIQF